MMGPLTKLPVANIRTSLLAAVKYIVLMFFVLLAICPILTGFITAFKPPLIQMASPPVWQFEPTLRNFRILLVEQRVGYNLLNSVIISGFSVIIALAVGIPAAYALSRFRLRGGQQLLGWIISLRMIPPVVVVIPFYIIFRQLGLFDTHLSLILIYQSLCIPLVIWMMRGYLADVPRDAEESAMVDGCTRLQALLRVVLPMIKAGIIATALMTLMFVWNDYLIALILTGRYAKTMPVAAANYVTRVQIEWGQLFAAQMLIVIPVIIVAIALRRHLVRGFTFGMVDR